MKTSLLCFAMALLGACGSKAKTCASYGGLCAPFLYCAGMPSSTLPDGDPDGCNPDDMPAGSGFVCCLPCPAGTVPFDGGTGPGCMAATE